MSALVRKISPNTQVGIIFQLKQYPFFSLVMPAPPPNPHPPTPSPQLIRHLLGPTLPLLLLRPANALDFWHNSFSFQEVVWLLRPALGFAGGHPLGFLQVIRHPQVCSFVHILLGPTHSLDFGHDSFSFQEVVRLPWPALGFLGLLYRRHSFVVSVLPGLLPDALARINAKIDSASYLCITGYNNFIQDTIQNKFTHVTY